MAAADPQMRIETLERALHWAELTIQKKEAEIQQLLERLRKQRVGFLGPASETLSDLQLELLVDQEPSTTREEVEAESRREPITDPRERKPHPGRKPLPENLPRIEDVIACEANCTHCGEPTKLIGYDTSEVLDREPAKWFVRVNETRKTCLRKMFCGEDGRTGAAHRGQGTGQRPRRDRNGGFQILRSCSAVPAGSDVGTRSGCRDFARDLGWLGDARGRVAGACGGRHARRFAARILYTSRRNDCAV